MHLKRLDLYLLAAFVAFAYRQRHPGPPSC
jgi:hypothetical protein